MFKYFIIIISILLIISVVFSVSYSDAYDLISSNLDNLNSVIQRVNGILGIGFDKVDAPVNVYDNDDEYPLGYYEYGGDKISISWYLLNSRLPSVSDKPITFIYPKTYIVELSALGREKVTYNYCIRYTILNYKTGHHVDFIYNQAGFMATVNNYNNIMVASAFNLIHFMDNDLNSHGYGIATIYQQDYNVSDYVRESMID